MTGLLPTNVTFSWAWPGQPTNLTGASKVALPLPFCKRYKFLLMTATQHQSVAGSGDRDCFPKVNIKRVDLKRESENGDDKGK